MNENQPDNKQLSWRIWISKKIQETMEHQEIPLGMLAIISCVSEEHLSMIQNAATSPSDSTMDKIARALGVPRSTFDPPEDFSFDK